MSVRPVDIEPMVSSLLSLFYLHGRLAGVAKHSSHGPAFLSSMASMWFASKDSYAGSMVLSVEVLEP